MICLSLLNRQLLVSQRYLQLYVFSMRVVFVYFDRLLHLLVKLGLQAIVQPERTKLISKQAIVIDWVRLCDSSFSKHHLVAVLLQRIDELPRLCPELDELTDQSLVLF